MCSFLHNWDNCGHGFTHAFSPLILTASGSLGIQASTSPPWQNVPEKSPDLPTPQSGKAKMHRRLSNVKVLGFISSVLLPKTPCAGSYVFSLFLSQQSCNLLTLGIHFSPLLAESDAFILTFWLALTDYPLRVNHAPSIARLCFKPLSHLSLQALLASWVRLLALDTDSLVKIPALSLWP